VEVSGLGRALSIQCVSQLIAITREGGSAVWQRLIARPQFKIDCTLLVVAAPRCACRRHFRYAVVLAAVITLLLDLPAQSAHGPARSKVSLAVHSIANNPLIC
jgi:hypothetical protein